MTQQTVEQDIDYREQVGAIVIEELELEPDELTDTGHFIEDYDSDSLSLITVVARIERELKVTIPKTDLGELVNLKLLVEAVAKYAGERTDG
ncbi:acyl carrier protein [Kitasatospora sp. GP82]|uniref:acyl carrier protein n=1 Tax=Kitasatospora sp. GP82 TaxID=3035089 RepID=UPI0024752DFB|nr:acyl carrier protein [Kitasatospora sp. GP82]MDH6125235.1 acyl carrier protein [Kitasatospora sp. GP82]